MSPRASRPAELARLRALLPPAPREEPRVPPAPVGELRPFASLVARVAGRVLGTGPPNIFTTLGRHPRLFRSWLLYSARLMPFGSLARRDSELVILRVAWHCRAAYEWRQHVAIGLRAGLSADQIAAVALPGAPRAGGVWSERQSALLAATDELLVVRALSTPTWERLRATLSERERIELCMLVGHYQGLATALGGLGVQVES